MKKETKTFEGKEWEEVDAKIWYTSCEGNVLSWMIDGVGRYFIEKKPEPIGKLTKEDIKHIIKVIAISGDYYECKKCPIIVKKLEELEAQK